MSRIYASNNDPLDFCKDCFPSEDEATERFGDISEGPDGRGNCFSYDTEHPRYDTDEFYCCECGTPLEEIDN